VIADWSCECARHWIIEDGLKPGESDCRLVVRMRTAHIIYFVESPFHK
jgi:hypothetical protein